MRLLLERGNIMKHLLLIFSLLLFSFSALADTIPERILNAAGCTKFFLCNAQTATGPCTVNPASGDEIVLNSAGRSSITFYGLQSVGNYSCDVFSNDKGFDEALGIGHKINDKSITPIRPILTLQGPLFAIWVECSTITTSATVTALLCPSNN